MKNASLPKPGKTEKQAHRNFLVALFLLFVVSLAITVVAWKTTESMLANEEHVVFLQKVAGIKNRLQTNMRMSVQGLYGLKAYWETGVPVTKEAWRQYVHDSQMLGRIPGISSAIYIQKVGNGEKDTHYIVTYIEPEKGRESAFGTDVSADRQRLLALERARDTGELAFTGNITLVTTQSPGFFAIVPLYEKEKPLETVDQKREALQGFATIVFKNEEFFRQLFGDRKEFEGIDFEIYNNERLTKENVLYDSDENQTTTNPRLSPRFSAKETLAMDGHQWVIAAMATPEFGILSAQKQLPFIVLISGMLISSTIFVFFLFGFFQHMRLHQTSPS